MSSISSQLLNPPTYRYPSIRSGFEWSSFGLDSLATEKFYNFREAKADSKLTVYAGNPDYEEELSKSKYVEGIYNGIVYIDKDKEDGYKEEFDKLIGKMKLFVSSNGAYLLQQYKKTSVGVDEIAIFLELPERDFLSKNVLLIKSGKNVQSYIQLFFNEIINQEIYSLSDEQAKALIAAAESGHKLINQVSSTLVQIKNRGINFIEDISIEVLNSLIDFFGETMRIDEKHWNSDTEGYSVEKIEKQIADFIKNRISQMDNWVEGKPKLPAIVYKLIKTINRLLSGILDFLNKTSENIQNLWASLSGFWNGLVDLVSSLFGLVKLVFQGFDSVLSFTQNREYYKDLTLEYLDNLWQEVLDINWVEWFSMGIQAAKELISFLVNELPNIAKKKIEALQFNQTEISYYGGYLVFEIISYIFPPLKVGKLGKVEKITAVMDEAAKGVSLAVNKGIVVGRNIAEDFFKQIDTFIKGLKNSSQELKKFFDDLILKLRKQVDEVVKAFDAPKVFRSFGVSMRIVKEGGKEIHVLEKGGKRIFEGTQKETLEIAERIKGKTHKEAKEILEEVADKLRKLKLSQKMWKEFEYIHLFKVPPTKIPCFLEGTKVKTENGYQNIETLEAGDLVWSYNIKTEKNELQAILQTFQNKTDKYVKIITLQGESIKVTGTHRFYMPLSKKWKEASALSLGDYLYNPFTEDNIQIKTLERTDQEVKTYNIEVAQNHNYLVSPLDILTHNNSRYLKYNSLEEYFFEFYTLNDRISKIPQYAGITIQELDKRYVQHIEESKRALEGIKPYNKWKLNTEISSAVIKNASGEVIFASRVGGVKTTFFEARVIEQYLISYFGGGLKHKGLGILLNRQNAMSQYAFIQYKNKFNPCKYFV